MPAQADAPLRVAFYHTELYRDGPGLLLRDIQRGKDAQVKAVTEVIAAAAPDVIAVASFDWDQDGLALTALQSALATAGHPMPHRFAAQPNRGMRTGLDLNGNGQTHDAEDAQGFAAFTGQHGLAVLSRWPVVPEQVRDDTALLWRDLPGASLPYPGQPEGLSEIRRLSTTAHWVVPIETPQGETLWLGTYYATSPVFDGPEDRNGRRNRDETAYWLRLLDGALPPKAPSGLVIAGHANLDRARGEGDGATMAALLDHPQIQDPAAHRERPTVDWRRDDLENMRVSYVLPDTTWRILDAGIVAPDAGLVPADVVETASRHRLIWVDLAHR